MKNKWALIKFPILIVWLISLHPAAIGRQFTTDDPPYFFPAFGGTFTAGTATDVSGIYVEANTATIQTEDSASYLTMKWNRELLPSMAKQSRIRFCLASTQRSYQYFEIYLTGSAVPIGSIDLAISSTFQVVEYIVPRSKLKEVVEKGILIRCRGKGKPVSVFMPSEKIPSCFYPHFLNADKLKASDEFLKRLASRATLSNFGWSEGCVQDGLAMMAEKYPEDGRYAAALKDHISLIYGAGMVPKVYNTIEATLGVAQLARLQPDHPSISEALKFWEKLEDSLGAIIDRGEITAEGSYTVAWPLAVLSAELNRPDLAEKCITQLRLRRDRLLDEQGAIWLRNSIRGNPKRTYRLWSRGAAWYILGLAKSLDILPNPPEDLIREFQRAAAYLISFRTKEGLWRLYADDPSTIQETSGACGIAAALAIGVRRQWLDKDVEKIARKALKGAYNKLTPDGFLTNVANNNMKEGGEDFQRRTKGVILQFGMGMMAQLVAELSR